jgi:hypothetical protein
MLTVSSPSPARTSSLDHWKAPPLPEPPPYSTGHLSRSTEPPLKPSNRTVRQPLEASPFEFSSL